MVIFPFSSNFQQLKTLNIISFSKKLFKFRLLVNFWQYNKGYLEMS